MALVSLRQLLDHAAEHDYALPAFNVNNMEQMLAIMAAADETDSPVIMQASRGARAFANDIVLSHLIRAAIELMEADPAKLQHRNAFNLTAMQVTPETLAAAMREHVPDFAIDYDVDPVRQGIAESWPRRIDDSAAREEWGWRPEFDVAAMTADMLANLTNR